MKALAGRASHEHPERAKTPSKPPRTKKGVKVSKEMIKRVEGGGMGKVNPMGWYDAEDIGTPDGTPTHEVSDPLARERPRPSVVREVPEDAIEDEPEERERVLTARVEDAHDEERTGGEDTPPRVFSESPPPMDVDE
jgi:hypothetical protein